MCTVDAPDADEDDDNAYWMRRMVILKLRYIFNVTWKKMSCFMLYVVLLLLRMMMMISTVTRMVNLSCETDFLPGV